MEKFQQKPQRKNHFQLEKEDLTDIIKLSNPPDSSQICKINKLFELKDLLDNIPQSKNENQKIFLVSTKK